MFSGELEMDFGLAVGLELELKLELELELELEVKLVEGRLGVVDVLLRVVAVSIRFERLVMPLWG